MITHVGTDLGQEYTNEQIDALKTIANCENVRVLDCNDPEKQHIEPCRTLPKLPALCHPHTTSCYPGVSNTAEHFEELSNMTMEKLAKLNTD